MTLMTYKGYELTLCPNGYRSKIDGELLRFDTAGQWKSYIDYYENTRKEDRTRSN